MDEGGMGVAAKRDDRAESAGGRAEGRAAGQATRGLAATPAAESCRDSADGASESGSRPTADHASAPTNAAKTASVFTAPTDHESVREIIAVAAVARSGDRATTEARSGDRAT